MDVYKTLRDRREAIDARLKEITEATEAETRAFSAEENTEIDALVAERGQNVAREGELREQELGEIRADRARLEIVGSAGVAQTSVINEPNPVYRKDDHTTSFFRDLAAFQLNTNVGTTTLSEARGRLAAAQETRAGDMTTAAGAGGEFAPPLWLVEDFIALARAGRVTADLVQKDVLPSGISSVNLPKVATGASAGVQATQNSALSDTAMTTTSVSSGITTVGGKQIISMQLLQQSGIPFDRVILQDLAKAYAVQVDKQVLYGSGASGQVTGLVTNAVNNAFTSASPAPASVTNANSLYYVISKAAAAVQTALYNPADAIIMHPNRWAWILGSVDANSRPLVIPAGPQFNGLGNVGGPVAQGFAGSFGGYNVYTDPNISTTANSATNQDEIYVLRRDEHWLWESPVQTNSFDATYADNASVLFRILGYLAFIGNRYTGACQSIRGTGLIAP
jgi:HK97 family phage major capsid protein